MGSVKSSSTWKVELHGKTVEWMCNWKRCQSQIGRQTLVTETTVYDRWKYIQSVEGKGVYTAELCLFLPDILFIDQLWFLPSQAFPRSAGEDLLLIDNILLKITMLKFYHNIFVSFSVTGECLKIFISCARNSYVYRVSLFKKFLKFLTTSLKFPYPSVTI